MKESKIWKMRTYFYVGIAIFFALVYLVRCTSCTRKEEEKKIGLDQMAFWPPDIVPHPHPPQPEPRDNNA